MMPGKELVVTMRSTVSSYDAGGKEVMDSVVFKEMHVLMIRGTNLMSLLLYRHLQYFAM